MKFHKMSLWLRDILSFTKTLRLSDSLFLLHLLTVKIHILYRGDSFDRLLWWWNSL